MNQSALKTYLTFILLFYTLISYSQNYTVLGDAVQLSGCDCYRFTQNANNQGGAIYQVQTINLNNSFDFTFSVFLGCNNGSGADGLVFVLTSNPNGLGQRGGGLGYAGGNQPFSLGVEFDTYYNSQNSDLQQHHIGINSGGNINHNVAGPVPAVAGGANIDDCQNHTVRIVWDVNTNTYSIYFDGNLMLTQVFPNLVDDYFDGNPIVNWGWSGATGGSTNEQRVCVESTSNWVAGVNYQSCSPSIQFTDVSTSNVGNIQSWAWDFGDGNTSTQQNPTHTYSGNGTYNVNLTITNINGCANDFSHPVVIEDSIVLSAVMNEPPCNGGSNGSIEITPSQGFGPSAGYGGYSYDWSNGSSQGNNIGITAGTYTVTVTDGVCNTVGQYTLDQPTPLTANTNATDASCGANDGSVSITISGGTPPYQNISWAGVPGATRTGLGPGMYIADFEDANGCSALLQYTATVGDLPCGINTNISSTDVSCLGGSDGTISISVTGGSPPATMSWNHGPNGFNINGLAAGTYTYNYSDDASPANDFSGSVTISEPPVALQGNLTTINTSCEGINDGSAVASVTSGGNPPYTYNWSGGLPNNPVVNNLSPGPVSVTIIDNLDCEVTLDDSITGPSELLLAIDAVDDSCYQAGTGSANANVSGGNPPYTYFWNNVSSAQNNLELSAGTYTVTVTDNKGCTIIDSTVIGEPADFSYNLDIENVTCSGDSNGSIEIANLIGGTAPYTYAWTPPQLSGNNPTGLGAGTYSFTVNDANSCNFSDSVEITEPDSALFVSHTHTDVSCFGADDGSITLYISGGTAPYSYMSNLIPNDSITIDNLPPGFFSGNIEDANGCTFFVSQTISEPAHIAITETHIDASCFGISDGSIDITVFGGISPYSFEWSDTVYTEDRNNLSAGTYNLTIIDSNSCEDSISIAIDEPAEVPLTIDVTDADCFGDLGSATAIPSEGSGPYDFQWDNSSENSATVALINGNHNVTATSSEGCEQTATFTINSQPQIILQASTYNPDCYGDTSGAITLNVSGGVGGFSYNWTPPVSNAENASNLPAGEYQIQITDQNNCSEDTTIHIIAPEELDVVSTAENETCFDANDGSININSNGGTAPYTYNWNDGTSETIRENLAPGVYSLTITDASGCSTVIIDSIEAALPIWVRTDSSVYTIYEGQQIEINSESFTDGKNILAYDWQPITGLDCPDCESVTAAPVESETYTLSIVDEAGCTADTTFEIIVLNEQVFYAPSVFTPNGDGINDGYGIKAEGVINFKFQIFDRWGTLIFETNDINEEWDGTYKGKLLPPDVFVYKAYADFLDKSSLRKEGSLTLIR